MHKHICCHRSLPRLAQRRQRKARESSAETGCVHSMDFPTQGNDRTNSLVLGQHALFLMVPRAGQGSSGCKQGAHAFSASVVHADVFPGGNDLEKA